jgi:hypothetical protein
MEQGYAVLIAFRQLSSFIRPSGWFGGPSRHSRNSNGTSETIDGPQVKITSRTSRVSVYTARELPRSNFHCSSPRAWDSILQSRPPIEPGATISQRLFEFGFSPLPDQIKVIAAVWTDGETFGAPASVNIILNNRARPVAEYEDAAGILRQGLSQNWTGDQYQQAFRDKPDTGAVYTVRTALSATLQNRSDAPSLHPYHAIPANEFSAVIETAS